MSKTMNCTCRICLTKTDKPKKTKILSKKLVQRIEDASGVELKLLDDYPNRICIDCLEMLDISLKFREMCRSSENALLGLAVKPVLKTEPQEVDDDNITVKSDQDNFFGNFVDCREVEDISEIAEFSMDGLETKEGDNDENQKTNENNKTLEKTLEVETKVKEENPKPVDKSKDQTKAKKQPQKFPSKKGRKTVEETGGGSIMCEICGNIYKQRNLLNMHMRRHLEFKPYDCEICSKSFACASEIRRHMRIHTGEKPYQCKFCGRSFADRSTNIKHERTHTNTRPFQCLTCGKSFTYSNVLKNHMLTHTGEKNFPCLPCNKNFSRKHQLDQHCATITHQQTIRCLEAAEQFQSKRETNVILDNSIVVQPLLLVPKNEEILIS